MRGEALCLLTPSSSLPKPESARTQLSSAQCREGWPNITRCVLADASSEATCLRFDAADDANIPEWISEAHNADSRAGTVAASCRRADGGTMRCAVNNVWSRTARVQIIRVGKVVRLSKLI